MLLYGISAHLCFICYISSLSSYSHLVKPTGTLHYAAGNVNNRKLERKCIFESIPNITQANIGIFKIWNYGLWYLSFYAA